MATKQEEILKAMTKELEDIHLRDYDASRTAKWILGILSSQGVVIKVERELPDETLIGLSYDKMRRVLNAGYVAVESLVE